MLALSFPPAPPRASACASSSSPLVGTVLLGLLLAVILSLPQVSGLFEERASLIQSYDAGRFGRFGRHILGAELSLDHPFGIGPLQFSKYFPEDPHNSFLDSFMAGGWLSGAAYFALILLTLVIGLRFVSVPAPWRRTYFALYASFVALSGGELHHRCRALAALFPDHGRAVGPLHRRVRQEAATAAAPDCDRPAAADGG